MALKGNWKIDVEDLCAIHGKSFEDMYLIFASHNDGNTTDVQRMLLTKKELHGLYKKIEKVLGADI